MYFRFLVLFLFHCLRAHSQGVVKLRICDFQSRPLAHAIISFNGNVYHSSGSGSCAFSHPGPKVKISVHKLGFADTTFFIPHSPETNDTLEITIRMRLKSISLPEVAISAKANYEINPKKADFILGYELKDHYIVELLSEGHILLINETGEGYYFSSRIKGATDVIRDPFGNLYVETEKNAFKIKSDSIANDPLPEPKSKIKWNLQYLECVSESTTYLRRYKDNNQTVAFFAVSLRNRNHARLMKEITDAERKNAVACFAAEARSINQYAADLGISKVTASTLQELDLAIKAENMANLLEMIYTLPSYSLLKEIKDSIFLFAHDIDSIFVFDNGWNQIRTMRINYHHLKIWDQELVVNEEKTKVYARFLENAKPMMAEIDLHTGVLISPFIVINHPFPNRIRIRKNTIYYMARQRNKPGYSLYAQEF